MAAAPDGLLPHYLVQHQRKERKETSEAVTVVSGPTLEQGESIKYTGRTLVCQYYMFRCLLVPAAAGQRATGIIIYQSRNTYRLCTKSIIDKLCLLRLNISQRQQKGPDNSTRTQGDIFYAITQSFRPSLLSLFLTCCGRLIYLNRAGLLQRDKKRLHTGSEGIEGADSAVSPRDRHRRC